MIPITVVILTHNEELNLPDCLDSLAAVTDDIQILDSGSTDGTVEIARERNIPVYYHKFAGFGDQRNWAIDNIPHQHSWVFHLDADERFTPELAGEIGRVLKSSPTEAGFFVANKMILGSTWLRYSSGYPVYQVRLFHRERLRYVNEGHGQKELTDGQIGFLGEPYLHFAFSKGIEHWLLKHVRYAVLEAAKFDGNGPSLSEDLSQIVAASALMRRRAIKNLARHLPARSLLRYFYHLIIKRGLLDGTGGIIFARLMSIYEDMITVCHQTSIIQGNSNGPSALNRRCVQDSVTATEDLASTYGP